MNTCVCVCVCIHTSALLCRIRSAWGLPPE
jgi:hypothetical protein